MVCAVCESLWVFYRRHSHRVQIQLLLVDHLCDNVHIYVNNNFLNCMHIFY